MDLIALHHQPTSHPPPPSEFNLLWQWWACLLRFFGLSCEGCCSCGSSTLSTVTVPILTHYIFRLRYIMMRQYNTKKEKKLGTKFPDSVARNYARSLDSGMFCVDIARFQTRLPVSGKARLLFVLMLFLFLFSFRVFSLFPCSAELGFFFKLLFRQNKVYIHFDPIMVA